MFARRLRNNTFFVSTAMLTIAGCNSHAPTTLPPSNIKLDEDVQFFPTYGYFDQGENVWRFDLHGKVFEPEVDSKRRATVIAILRMSANASVGIEDAAFLNDRIRPFLVDNERGKSITVEIAGQRFAAGTSERNGHFENRLAMQADLPTLLKAESQDLEVKAVLPDSDPRRFIGRLHLIAPTGISVVSDIDDTIKHSQVTDKSELIQNTFLRKFRAVDGMPKLYSDLAQSGAVFHYVSGSPWQLYQPIDAFMTDAGFPQGTFNLKVFRLTDSSAHDMLKSQLETKLAAITPILNAFPDRRFLLFGDSGEQDPEVYGQIARDYPNQIIGVYIRNVTGEDRQDKRFSDAFQGVPQDSYVLFDEVAQITDQIQKQLDNGH